MPIAAVTQIVAAVVMPLTPVSALKMTPAPTKPIPTTILEAILSGVPFEPIINEKIVNKVAPRQIIMIVLNPADLLRYSLSAPISPPITRARINLEIISSGKDMAFLFRVKKSLAKISFFIIFQIGLIIFFNLVSIIGRVIEQNLMPGVIFPEGYEFIC